MNPNPQQPFAYLPKPVKRATPPLNFKFDVLPSNYMGMCRYCLLPYQKLPKTPRCTRCNESAVKAFAADLLPWRLLPPNLSKYYYDYLQTNIPFHCIQCGERYSSLAIFSALCSSHKKHSIRAHRFCCRFCCKEVSEKMIKAIETAIANKPNINVRNAGTRTGRTNFIFAEWPQIRQEEAYYEPAQEPEDTEDE